MTVEEAETFLILKYGSMREAINAWMSKTNTDDFSYDEQKLLSIWIGVGIEELQKSKNSGMLLLRIQNVRHKNEKHMPSL